MPPRPSAQGEQQGRTRHPTMFAAFLCTCLRLGVSAGHQQSGRTTIHQSLQRTHPRSPCEKSLLRDYTYRYGGLQHGEGKEGGRAKGVREGAKTQVAGRKDRTINEGEGEGGDARLMPMVSLAAR